MRDRFIIKKGDTTIVSHKGIKVAFIDAGWYISLTTMNGICLKNYDGSNRYHKANRDARMYIDHGEIL